jgi:hypothetical protein
MERQSDGRGPARPDTTGTSRAKGYVTAERFRQIDDDYDHCGRMLEKPHQSLLRWRGSARMPTVIDWKGSCGPPRATSGRRDIEHLTVSTLESPDDA